MSLPSYKINNSYTVYVNYYYLNDCIKAGKKAFEKGNSAKSPNSKRHAKKNSDKGKKITRIKNDQTTLQENKTSLVKGSIAVGSTVHLLNLDTREKCTFILTLPENIVFGTNNISSASPVGRSLLNCKAGDNVSADIPSGTVRYKILSIASYI